MIPPFYNIHYILYIKIVNKVTNTLPFTLQYRGHMIYLLAVMYMKQYELGKVKRTEVSKMQQQFGIKFTIYTRVQVFGTTLHVQDQ